MKILMLQQQQLKFMVFFVHPGSAKNTMINATNVGIEFDRMLPQGEKPEHTEGYEGFYYLESFKGNTDNAILSYILRIMIHVSLSLRNLLYN